jgi:hypothetical protein
MVHRDRRAVASLSRRMGWDCIGDANLAETSERGADLLRVAHQVRRATPSKHLLLLLSVQLRPIRLFRGSQCCGLRARRALAAHKAQWAAAFAELAKEEAGGDATTPAIFFSKTWHSKLLSPHGANPRLVRWFPPDSRPQFSPTPFGATDSPPRDDLDRRRTMDHRRKTMDHAETALTPRAA